MFEKWLARTASVHEVYSAFKAEGKEENQRRSMRDGKKNLEKRQTEGTASSMSKKRSKRVLVTDRLPTLSSIVGQRYSSSTKASRAYHEPMERTLH